MSPRKHRGREGDIPHALTRLPLIIRYGTPWVIVPESGIPQEKWAGVVREPDMTAPITDCDRWKRRRSTWSDSPGESAQVVVGEGGHGGKLQEARQGEAGQRGIVMIAGQGQEPPQGDNNGEHLQECAE